jgi:hypothetical protein
MFNIQDPDAKISPEVRDRIEDLSNKLLDGVNDIAALFKDKVRNPWPQCLSGPYTGIRE